MGKEPANSSRARWPFRSSPTLLLLVLLLAAVPAAVVTAQSGPVPMGIIVQPEPHDLQVRIATDRSRYDRGDELEIEFWVNRDAHVYIYNLDAAGKVTLIFPNRYERDNLVRAGTHRLPGRRSYALVVRGPDGIEYLQIIATAAPIGFYDAGALDREAFPSLGAPGSVESRVRAQLQIVPARQWAVDWTSYRVGREVSQPSPPPPPTWERRGWLRVESNPSNSYVYVDGSYEGQTPLLLRLEEGRYRVEVRRDGYRSKSEWVRVRANEETRIHMTLEREPRWEPSPPPPPPPPTLPPTTTPSPAPTPPPSEPTTREHVPYFRVGFDVGFGPDPDEPGREVFSFGGDFGGPFFGLGFSIRYTGESLWNYQPADDLTDFEGEKTVTVEEGPESEIYGRFTIVRSGDFVIRTGVGLAWQKETTVLEQDYLHPPKPDDIHVGRGYSEIHVYPTALIGAGVEHGFGYFWAGYHIRRGMVVGAGFRF